MSRVKEGNDIRLLLTNKDWNTLDYLASLEKNPEVAQFFKGYPDLPNEFVRWDSTLTITEVGESTSSSSHN